VLAGDLTLIHLYRWLIALPILVAARSTAV